MTTGNTTLLELALPVEGELDGQWGDVVNYGITNYVDIAVAGTLTLNGDGAVDLVRTKGTELGTNIGATTAQYAIIRITGTLTTTKVITAPSVSKTYVVDNAATGGAVTFKAAGQTGVSVAVSEKCTVYYNGTDFVKVASSTAQVYPGAGVSVSTGTAWGTSLTAPSGALVGTTDTQTLTNKRINPRVSSTADTTTLTPDVSAFDQYNLTAQARALTVAAPTGTPVDGTKLILRILDNGTSRAITWNATYISFGVPLPAATTADKTLYVGCIYNANNSRWDVIAVNQQI
jgi:hypothetical protein